VAVPVAVDRERVDGVHRVARGDEGADQQSPVELDAHDDVRGLLGVRGDYLVEPGQTLEPLRHPALGEHPPLDVHHAHVVAGLRPVDPDEDHPSSLPC